MNELRVLVAEDSEDDFLLVSSELESAGFDVTLQRVETAEDMRRALADSSWDLVLSDYTMPQFDALAALQILRESAQADLPFIIVSGSIGEVRAVAALKAGAADYVMKANLDKLVPVVQRELSDAAVRRERSEAFEALRQAVKARDEFLSIASHELKTPLTSLSLQVQSLVKALQGGAPEVRAPELLLPKAESLARSCVRLSGLVDRLLDIARVTTGRLELMLETVELGSLARSVAARLDGTFEEARCRLIARVASPVVGTWDAERIEMVLSNLLTNAAKFGEGKPVVLELEDLGDAARVRVIDEGIGISEVDQQRIFGRFERAVPEHHYGGFGVGLWLSQQIIHAHGGSIAVASSPGAGSTFTVTLPKERRA